MTTSKYKRVSVILDMECDSFYVEIKDATLSNDINSPTHEIIGNEFIIEGTDDLDLATLNVIYNKLSSIHILQTSIIVENTEENIKNAVNEIVRIKLENQSKIINNAQDKFKQLSKLRRV